LDLSRGLGRAEGVRRYRSRYEIVAEIIRAAMRPAHPMEIVHQTRLNTSVVSGYLHSLVNAGLIRRGEGSKYEATPDGLEYLERYERIKQLLEAMSPLHEER
jgi:predicted transcriptional regulator